MFLLKLHKKIVFEILRENLSVTRMILMMLKQIAL